MYKLIKDDVCDRSGVRSLTYICDSTEDLYSIGRAPAGSTAFVPSVNAVYTMSPSGAWVFTPDTEWALAEQSDTKPKQVLSKRLSANLSAFTITKAGEEITTGASLVTGDTLTITVEPNAGYEALCLANGAVLGVSNTSETYTYVVGPGKQVTITAAAAADKAFDLIFNETGCTISVTGPDGAILPGENMILNGTTITITTEADPDHVISTFTVNGDAFTSGDTLVVNRDVTVEALALELFDITITTDEHCDVVVNGGEYTDGSTALDGTLISIEATAHEGYILEENSITVNGNPYTEPFVLEGDITVSAGATELLEVEIIPVVAGGHLLTQGPPEDLTYRHDYIAYLNPAYSPIVLQDNIYLVINDGNGDIEKRLIYGRIELPGLSSSGNAYAAYDPLDRYDYYGTGLQDSQSWIIKISDDLFAFLSYDESNGYINIQFNGAHATTATVVRMYHKLIPVEITSITTLNCSVAISDGVTVFDVNDSIYAWTPVTVTATAETGYAIESLLMKVNGGLVVNGHTFVADSNTTEIVITASVQQESSTISLLSGGPISTWVETEVDPEEMPGVTFPIADMTNVDIALSGLVEGRDDINLTYVLNGASARTVTDLKVGLSESSDFLSDLGTYSISAKETMDIEGIMLLDAEGNPSVPIMLSFSEEPNDIFEGSSTSKPTVLVYATEQSYKEDIAGAYIKLSTGEYVDPTQVTLYSEGYVLDAVTGTYIYNGSSYALLSGITDRYARAEDVAGTHVLDGITGNYRLYNSETDGALTRYNFALDNSTPGGYILLATDLYGDLTTLSLYSEGFVEDVAGTYINDDGSYNLVSSYTTKYAACGWSEVNTLSITSINIGKENILNSFIGTSYDSVEHQAWVTTFSLTERIRSATLYELIYTYNDVTTKTVVESIYVDGNQPTGPLMLLEPSFRGTVPISTDNETAKIKLGEGLYASIAAGGETSPLVLSIMFDGANAPGELDSAPVFAITALNRITPMSNGIGSPITVDTPFDETWYQVNLNGFDHDFFSPYSAEAISVLYTYLGVEYGARLVKSLPLREYHLGPDGNYVLVADEYVVYDPGNPAHEGLDRYYYTTYYTFGTDLDNLYIREREDGYYILHKLPISEGVTLEVTRLMDADYTVALQIE